MGARGDAWEPPRCEICGDVVGVYEPAVFALKDGGHETGSLLTVGADRRNGRAAHVACVDILPSQDAE